MAAPGGGRVAVGHTEAASASTGWPAHEERPLLAALLDTSEQVQEAQEFEGHCCECVVRHTEEPFEFVEADEFKLTPSRSAGAASSVTGPDIGPSGWAPAAAADSLAALDCGSLLASPSPSRTRTAGSEPLEPLEAGELLKAAAGPV